MATQIVWKEHYKGGDKKFTLLYPLSPDTAAFMQGHDITFDRCDRETQFSVLFTEWVKCESQGHMCLSSNDQQEAQRLFEECFNRALQLDVDILKGRSMEGFLRIAGKQGDRAKQMEYIKEAKKYYEESNDLDHLQLDKRLAMLMMDEGKLIQAEKLLVNVLQKVENPKTIEEVNLKIGCLIDRATIKRYKNEWDAALEILNECEKTCNQMSAFTRMTKMTSVHFIRTKIYLIKYSLAYDLDKAEKEVQKLKEIGTLTWGSAELESDIAFKRGDWRKAIDASLKAIAMIEKEGWIQASAAKCIQAANAYIELGDTLNAERMMQKADEYIIRHRPPDLHAKAMLIAALLEWKKGNADESWRKALESLEGIENLIHFHNSILAQQLFLLDKLEYYHTAFDIALSKEGEEGVLRAWQVAERSKSFYICQLVANSDVPLFEGVREESLVALKEIEAVLDQLEIKIRLNENNPEILTEATKQLEQTYRNKEQLLERIMQDNPRWASVRKPESINVKKVYREFHNRWTFLSYYWRNKDGKQLYSFYFDKDGIARRHQENWTQDEYEFFIRKRDILLRPGEKEAFDQLLPSRIAAKIFPPDVINQLTPNVLLLISPHDILRGLPIHMFSNQDGVKPIDLFAGQYIPTLSLLGLIKNNKVQQSSALFMGCPKNGFGDAELKEVPEELNALAAIWKEKGNETHMTIIEENETPESKGFPVEKWNNLRLLHIACHGAFSVDEPMSSALRLGRDAVRGSEFFGYRLNTETVAFSACELGRQKAKSSIKINNVDTGGDEWIGMYLPLFYAGVKNLLVSLWTANSEQTPFFMRTFNTALAENELPAIAFKKACSEMQSKPNSYWGNWYLVGFPS